MNHRAKEEALEGFSLIEAALAIGIGGAVLAMVFFVLPGAFANARDGQRRDDVLLTLNRLKNFQANNNRGALPTGQIDSNGIRISGNSVTFGPTSGVTWLDFYKSFFNDSYVDPGGNRYNWRIINCGTSSMGTECPSIASFMNSSFDKNDFTMYFVVGSTCKGDTAVATANTRAVSVLYKLERAGTYCANT